MLLLQWCLHMLLSYVLGLLPGTDLADITTLMHEAVALGDHDAPDLADSQGQHLEPPLALQPLGVPLVNLPRHSHVHAHWACPLLSSTEVQADVLDGLRLLCPNGDVLHGVIDMQPHLVHGQWACSKYLAPSGQ